MSTNEDNQFDVLEFLSQDPKTIVDFRRSEQFWVEALGRGVYPRSLLDMLIDMDLVDKFSPYKSTEEEIDAFIKQLGNLSDDRKQILSKYTSFRLTESGLEVTNRTPTQKKTEDDAVDKESFVVDEFKTEGTIGDGFSQGIVSDQRDNTIVEIYGNRNNGMSEPEQQKALVSFLEKEPDLYSDDDLKEKYETPTNTRVDKLKDEDPIDLDDLVKIATKPIPDVKNEVALVEEIKIVEGEKDEDEIAEDEMRRSVRIVQINDELESIEAKLSQDKIKKKERKHLIAKKEELSEERRRLG